MKYAFVNGKRMEAEHGLVGICQGCGKPMISKCGQVKVKHWAHKESKKCDKWWENESEWHRSWKNKFPEEWQEISSRDETGELHIADVKTDKGWVIEFQHSILSEEERISRNKFYKKLVWVVNGKRASGNEIKFQSALMGSMKLENFYKMYPEKCSLVKEWINSIAPVFFDFGESGNILKTYDLWLLMPKSSDGMAYLKPFDRMTFLQLFDPNISGQASDIKALILDLLTVIDMDNDKWEVFHRSKLDKIHNEIRSEKMKRRSV